jgi:hypothetical protein
VISGERYDSFVYICYLNGAMDPAAVSWFTGLLRSVSPTISY